MAATITTTTPVAGTNVTVDDFGEPVVTDLNTLLDDKRVYTATDGATVTFDQDNGAIQKVQLGGNRTLAVSNVASNSVFFIILQQDGTGSRTVTWFSGIKWDGGVTPTLTTTASKYDAFAFIQLSAGSYLGMTMGLNM